MPLEIHFEPFLALLGRMVSRWPLETPFELKGARVVCQKGNPLGNRSKIAHNYSCQMQMTPQAWHYRWQRLLHVILLGWCHRVVLCNLILFFTGFVDPSGFPGKGGGLGFSLSGRALGPLPPGLVAEGLPD